MNVAITGHTSGIGLALFNYFVQNGHTVIGFSRANGYDISTDAVDSLVRQAESCDLFVNNAYHPVGQNIILKKMLETWQDSSKCLVNISSNIVNVSMPMNSKIAEYKTAKLISNQIINSYQGPVNILNVLPDLVKTNFYLGGSLLEHGMDPDYVADLIIKHICLGVSELVIRHPGWK